MKAKFPQNTHLTRWFRCPTVKNWNRKSIDASREQILSTGKSVSESFFNIPNRFSFTGLMTGKIRRMKSWIANQCNPHFVAKPFCLSGNWPWKLISDQQICRDLLLFAHCQKNSKWCFKWYFKPNTWLKSTHILIEPKISQQWRKRKLCVCIQKYLSSWKRKTWSVGSVSFRTTSNATCRQPIKHRFSDKNNQ